MGGISPQFWSVPPLFPGKVGAIVCKHWKVGLMVVALAVVAGGALGTYAWFADVATMEGKTFTSGTLEISLEGADWLGRVDNMQPGDTATFRVTVRSTGSLPLDYTIEESLEGDLAGGEKPCYVSGIRVDGALSRADSLSARDGDDAEDLVEIEITMPPEAGSEYEGKSGELVVAFAASQQP